MNPFHLIALAISLAVLSLTTTADRATAAEAPAETISKDDESFFEAKIRPLLIEHCYECHSRETGESSGDLFLDDAASTQRGGTLGPALIAGDPQNSLIMKAVRYDDSELQMPPEGKLDDSEIDLLEQWIRRGAPDPRSAPHGTDPSGPDKISPMEIDPRSHWAFNVPLPSQTTTPGDESDRDLIDTIARQAADAAGIAISPPCDDEQLIRRLYHDLTGLPPNLDQIKTYCESDQIDKRERLIDQLLASPAYAERFARHWMDIARYADTVGYALAGKERRLEGSERYRDWLIKAFASDIPYDEMIRLQIAGDRLDPDNKAGNLDAMGFLTIGRRFLNRFDTIDDRIDVITRGLLGMTVACARCHDHKFDPIPTKDYYSLLGIIDSSEQPNEGASPLMMVDKESPADSKVFVRGQPHNRGEVAPRQFLTALRQPDEPRFNDGSGRLELAQRIASADNPLVARVYVNRIWTNLIGRPFVDSASDFGVRTTAPPLVELLDELAVDFSSDWSVKRLIRRITNSRLYAQSAEAGDADALQADPENRLAARGNRRRRDFESLRDSILAVSGQLDRRVGGAPVEIHLGSPSPRRTLYAMIDRQNLPSLFRTFDFASPDAHTPKRFFTTVPQQALFLMNHPQIGTLAESIATQSEPSSVDHQIQVQQLFNRILSRAPSQIELEECVAFLSQTARSRQPPFDSRRAWQYGTSPANPESRVETFRPLPVFTGSSWQDGPEIPADTELRYASIGVENGHPGPRHAVVRRWTAPADGRVTISGMVGHRNEQGDGVELAIWVGGERVWRENQKSNNRPFNQIHGDIQAGQTVDFVVSPRESDNSDSFYLRCQISLAGSDGEFYEGDSQSDFAGPQTDEASESLDRLAQLAQTLMLSNEFIFVD
ncbi:PSD1 and planctomycete cytochrome C domain-containing protein [Stieleria sp. TO1_6]|uniref:PSD1 and planctomycete cytochrome C domain-containing protein n=1 Tax=Stieleria tagensis TaxID=2956795 RepID=UPI00209B6DAB|nr:PSD1 and planctomycete cytochrome C domain-containing protein [Stieleria tagensis]MCO8123019.1 PSD1 and planctomycete cytochrome C domain-containing protein [Stieleria tagensis]